MERVIDAGEFLISSNKEDVFKIYGLSSCIGLVMYCPKIKLLSVAHILLPSSTINPELSEISPAYFADSCVDTMIDVLTNKYFFNKREIVVSIYGGAESKSEKDVFNIGNRNTQAVKGKLSEYGLRIREEDVGGSYSRTIAAEVLTGNVKLQLQKYITF